MTLKYGVTGDQRKKLVRTLSEILQWEPTYMGAPTFAYQVGNYTVDKDGNIDCPTAATPDIIDIIVARLKEHGFELQDTANNRITVELPRASLTDEQLERMKQIIASKASVFKKALGADSLPIAVNEEKICFPWFTDHGIDGEADAYIKLIAALAERAKNVTRVTAKENASDNDKFTMRLFLVNLGFKGDEYKLARKILTQNLSGNGGWKTPKTKAVLEAASEQATDPEAEGGEADAGISK